MSRGTLNGIVVITTLIAAVFTVVWFAGRSGTPAPGLRRSDPGVRATLSAVEAMGGDDTGYARATEPRPFTFPEDHGAHPGYRTEWWYVTGNLETDTGRRFGYQLTFFRNEMAPPPARATSPDGSPRAVSDTNPAAVDAKATAEVSSSGSTSDWATRDVYMAHLAVTDVEGEVFHAFERFSRGALELAGAESHPFRVWLESWEMAAVGEDSTFPVRLKAADGEIAIDLVVDAGKAPVLQGIDGLSPKGPEPGNASYYYAITRMPTRGTIRVGEAVHEVNGSSWMDREWGTSALGEDQVGWDWFSLQLSDGGEVMHWQLRPSREGVERFSEGAVIDADGTRRYVRGDQARLDVLGHWNSPLDGTTYPSHWRLRIDDEEVDLEVTPLLADQELDLTVRYWEGAVRVEGTRAGRPVHGYGFVEMTGYGDHEGGGRR